MTFLLSIEPRNGAIIVEPFHLGTDEAVARKEAMARFHGRIRFGMATASVALLDADSREIVAVYDGSDWSDEMGEWDFDESDL